MWEQILDRFVQIEVPSKALNPDLPLHFRLSPYSREQEAIRFDALDAKLFEPTPFNMRATVKVLHTREGKLLSRGYLGATTHDLNHYQFVGLPHLYMGNATVVRPFKSDLLWPTQLRAEWLKEGDDLYVDFDREHFRDSLLQHLKAQRASEVNSIFRMKNEYEDLHAHVTEHTSAV